TWQALQPAPTIQRAGPDVARAVKHAVSRALAPVPADRCPTATEFAAALGAPAHRTSVPTRGVFAGSRGRRAALVLGGAFVLLGAGAVLLLRQRAPYLNDRRVVVALIE